jgi:NADH-quinone oxidoreductase subunit N
MLIGVVISIFYYFGWIREITFHPRPTFNDESDEGKEDPWAIIPRMGFLKFSLLALTISSLVLGIWQGPFGDAF